MYYVNVLFINVVYIIGSTRLNTMILKKSVNENVTDV
jgi:hypothetical protein